MIKFATYIYNFREKKKASWQSWSAIKTHMVASWYQISNQDVSKKFTICHRQQLYCKFINILTESRTVSPPFDIHFASSFQQVVDININ